MGETLLPENTNSSSEYFPLTHKSNPYFYSNRKKEDNLFVLTALTTSVVQITLYKKHTKNTIAFKTFSCVKLKIMFASLEQEYLQMLVLGKLMDLEAFLQAFCAVH